jgi:transposase
MVDSEKSPSMDESTVDRRGFFMAKKGQTHHQHPIERKEEAVRLHMEGLSYRKIAQQLGIRSKTEVMQRVKKHENSEGLEDQRGQSAWRKGRPKTKFTSIEEELAYIKAENEYLKKRYPNLHGE